MRIGIFTDTYKPSINKTSLIIDELVREERKLGHKVFIIAPSHSEVVEDTENVVRISEEIDLGEYNIAKRYVAFSSKDKKAIQELKLDVVHTFGYGSVAKIGKRVASLENIPYVSTVLRDEMVAFEKERTNLNKKVSSLSKKLYQARLNSVVAKSRHITSFYPSTCKDEIDSVVKFGFDIKLFNSTSDEEIENISKKLKLNNKNVYLNVTEFRREYDLTSLVIKFKDIVSKDKKAVLLVIGNGGYLESVNQSIIDNELEGKVVVIDNLNNLDAYYRIAKCFIYNNDIPSTYLYPVIAMMEGLPVIAAYSENLNDLIKDYKNGLFYHTIDELEDMIKRLSKDEELNKQLVSNKNNVIKEYSSSVYAKNMETVYLKAIRNKNSEKKDDMYKNRKHRRYVQNKK